MYVTVTLLSEEVADGSFKKENPCILAGEIPTERAARMAHISAVIRQCVGACGFINTLAVFVSGRDMLSTAGLNLQCWELRHVAEVGILLGMLQ